eukprot:2698713-Rhodomonas_salina.6
MVGATSMGAQQPVEGESSRVEKLDPPLKVPWWSPTTSTAMLFSKESAIDPVGWLRMYRGECCEESDD